MNALLRAIELSDSLAEAHYSLGVIWVEKANDMVEKLNAEGVSDKEYEALKAEQIGYFESCLPYFERALELEPEDQLTLNALKMVYYKARYDGSIHGNEKAPGRSWEIIQVRFMTCRGRESFGWYVFYFYLT